jgi:tetratricopeptide (TPR) repeat protein
MVKYLALAVILAVAFVSCSKSGKAEQLIKDRQYDQAIGILQKVLANDPKNPEATALMVKAQVHLNIEKSDSLVKAGDFEKALSVLSQAKIEDSALATPKIEALGALIINYVGKELVPQKNWEAAIRHLDLLTPFQVFSSQVAVARARVLYSQSNKLTWQAVEAFETAAKLDPAAEDIKKICGEISAKKAPFLKLFKEYYEVIVKKNFPGWQKRIDANYVENIKADIKRITENDPNLKIKTVKDYFDQYVATEPASQGSPGTGPEVVAIDLSTPDQAVIHYTYPKMAWFEKVTVRKNGTFSRPERSEKQKSL